jgi:hypothetical protein
LSITLARAQKHVAEQQRRLATTQQRSAWPQFLFHTTHVTNAVNIVRQGFLGARNVVENFHDVANQGALASFDASHDYARLYFRPRNPFHVRTEGIKCVSDLYRFDYQMSVPVCFIFLLTDVITRNDCLFSKGNVQRSHDFLTSDENFDTLDFNAIYHDSWTDANNRPYIHDCRMAEVAVQGQLPLAGGLNSIIFRTKWDMETFRHLCSEANVRCDHPLSVEQVRSSLFMNEGFHLTDLNFSDERIQLSFQFPVRNAPADKIYELTVVQNYPGGSLRFDKKMELSKPSLSIVNFKAEPKAIWNIDLERVLAFRGRLQHARSEIFG